MDTAEQMEAFIRQKIQDFVDEGIEYDEKYIRKQTKEQRPGTLTAMENMQGKTSIYYKLHIDPIPLNKVKLS